MHNCLRHLLCLVVVLVSSCYRADYHKPFQDQPLVSPSGKYVLNVPIEKAADNLHYWRVTISDRRDALSKTVGMDAGTLISCIPGKLAYFEMEGADERFILER